MMTPGLISFCATISAAPENLLLEHALNAVRLGQDARCDWRNTIAAIRLETFGNRRAELKRRLPAFLFAGTFNGKRAKDAFDCHSGLMVLDIDGHDNPGRMFEDIRAAVIADAHTLAAFQSPSGDGLKVIVPVEATDQETHYGCFRRAEKHYAETLGLKIDQSGKDVSRLCFASYDPELFTRDAAESFTPLAEEPRPAANPVPREAPAPCPTRAGESQETREHLIYRAMRYAAECDPSVSGQHGHNALLSVCNHLVTGFCLTPAEAKGVIYSSFNPRCVPPWDEKAIDHKISEAAKGGGKVQWGEHLNGKKPSRPADSAPQEATSRQADSAPRPTTDGLSTIKEAKKETAVVSGEPGAPAAKGALGKAENPAAAEEEKRYPENDWGNARRMAEAHADIIRFSDAGDWLVWRGDRWRRKGVAYVDQLWDEMHCQMYADSESDPESSAFRWAKKCGNAALGENMKKKLSSMKEIFADANDFDPANDVIACANGVLDLQTGFFREEHRPADMNTHCLSTNYVPDAESPLWSNFLQDLVTPPGGTPDYALLDYIQTAAGLSLLPYTSDRAVFILIGSGRNGKSTFLDAVADVLGDYVGHVDTDVFDASENRGNAKEYAINDQQGRRMTIGTETKGGMHLDEALIKTFTEETMTGRAIYHESKTYRNATKLWLYGNHLPYVRDADQGIWRRLKLIKLDANLDPARIDYQLGAKLHEPEQREAILAWLVQGARMWFENGKKLIEPPVIAESVMNWRAEMDKLGMFLEECCSFTDWETKASEVFSAYRRWCEKRNFKCQAANTFKADLTQWKGGAKEPPVGWKRTPQGAFYTGIMIKDETSWN